MATGPRVLFLDIETSPLLGYVWGIWDQNVGLNQIAKDWHLLSWSAKWKGHDKIYYEDQSRVKNIEDDKELLKGIWKLLDECDVAIGHNLDRFDVKKLNARFLKHGIPPPSSFKTIDTLKLAKKSFALTSNKLEFLATHLGLKERKSSHKRFQGFELWMECMKGNKDAWREMRRYNEQDVVVLEAVYDKLQPWSLRVNFNLYREDLHNICPCGNDTFKKNGILYTASGKYQRWKCLKCHSESRDGVNLLSKEKKKSLRK